MPASFDQLPILFLGLLAFFVGVSVGDLLDNGLINGQDDDVVDLYHPAPISAVSGYLAVSAFKESQSETTTAEDGSSTV
ncbi:hypothetical protein ACRE_024950 [Hapsidospora chrysogenum ATCC 11550]|uniref:Uncharacterized protein n=1 Tax=Hapsidospora chrysogenum (strain ATCC 11550 / CBS 779.69 / DSM 880 / IAM 14645 / JCM 23072 / IMI 49137) TaxID=857340 RepID=A0A086TB76_HAPC1|nr:hypothetical protein ACRE_024950 [Hapsidospora chrysogenum ATCC 11550]